MLRLVALLSAVYVIERDLQGGNQETIDSSSPLRACLGEFEGIKKDVFHVKMGKIFSRKSTKSACS